MSRRPVAALAIASAVALAVAAVVTASFADGSSVGEVASAADRQDGELGERAPARGGCVGALALVDGDEPLPLGQLDGVDRGYTHVLTDGRELDCATLVPELVRP